MSEEIINTVEQEDTKPVTDKRTDAVFPSYTFKDVYAMYDGSIYINKIMSECRNNNIVINAAHLTS